MHAGDEGCTLVLMLFCDAPDTYSATDHLRRMAPASTPAQQDVLKQCRAIVAGAAQCILQVHHQYGVSGPLLRNLIEFKRIELIIVPESYKTAPQKIHKYCCALLLNSKWPILLPGAVSNRQQMCNALYLENDNTTMALHEVQRLIDGKFPYRIVSRALVSEMQDPEDLRPILAETIFKNDIDVLVQTRKPEKLKLLKKAKATVNEVMGLPVLSLYEGAV
jgi:hypothetical protein